MSTPFVGEIKLFGGGFAPLGWAPCDGRLLQINNHDALFALIGTTYGGDGQTTFAVPDLRGRVPVHQGAGPGLGGNVSLGEKGGAESVTLAPSSMPTHNHGFVASQNPGSTTNPPSNVVAQIPLGSVYIQDAPSVQLASQSVPPTGGSQPHENMQPFLVITFIIALEGLFPQQT